MAVNQPVFSHLQSINPSAVIELFTLQLSTALHGANTIYRFHAGSNLNANGKIVWATNEYLRFPIQATGFAFQKGQLPRPKIVISNATGLISSILLSVNETTTGNDLTGATITRIRTLAKFIDAVNFADGTNATADPTAEFPHDPMWLQSISASYARIEVLFLFSHLVFCRNRPIVLRTMEQCSNAPIWVLVVVCW